MDDSTNRTGVGSPRLVHEEQARALREFERRLATSGKVPDAARLVSRRHAAILQALIAVAIGTVVALASIVLNFIVFTKLLHVQG